MHPYIQWEFLEYLICAEKYTQVSVLKFSSTHLFSKGTGSVKLKVKHLMIYHKTSSSKSLRGKQCKHSPSTWVGKQGNTIEVCLKERGSKFFDAV